MEDEYISVDQINTNNINNENNWSYVYQFQPQNNSNKVSLVRVGLMGSIYDVILKSFDLYDNTKCYLVSKVYNYDSLEKSNTFSLFQFNIIRNKIIAKLSLELVGNNDITTNNIKNKERVMIEGKYQIVFYHNNKKVILEELDSFPLIDETFDKLTEHLLSEKVMMYLININD